MSGDPAEDVDVTHDPDTGEYVAAFDPLRVDASIAVIEATAEIRSAAPDRHAPLFEVIDPDALDRICSGDDDTLVEFTYLDHRIRVRSGGHITVTPVESA
ncbi:HalOD1 output domain-containing protein [Halobaculum litoreum]|uniref:HalOD1 output domain-containing protein n=1 Tax=Halobaculum litoreum TaxID=3031998 RepID=A0ABD5XMN3_9EURY|nr:HalOD1 output domain-containing protein [Halobaculum sp. DT92]